MAVAQPRRGWAAIQVVDRALTSRFGWVPFGVVLAAFVAQQVGRAGAHVMRWDLLLITGWGALVAGLALAQTVPQRARRMLERMRDRGSLELTQAELSELCDGLDAVSVRWGRRAAWVVAGAIFVAFVVATRGNLALKFTLLVFEVVGAYAAGYHLGRMAGFGRLGPFLRARHRLPKVIPGHLDGVGGLKPVGDFFFYQALIVAIPAAFIAVWWVLISLGWNHHRYERWRSSYPGLLALAVVIEVLAFVVPLWSFHEEMARQKETAQKEADRMALEIAGIQSRLITDPSSQDAAQKERIAEATARYQAIEQMPTWPVDPATRRRFRLSNLALILPFIGQAIGQTEPWKEIAQVLEKLSR